MTTLGIILASVLAPAGILLAVIACRMQARENRRFYQQHGRWPAASDYLDDHQRP